MAYSSNNSTAVNVTNFGARGDGVTLDTSSIQLAIDSLYPKGGGTVLLPKGKYLTSGYIHITGHNITLLGEPNNTYLITSPSGDFKKINISGASGCNLFNLGIDAGRVSNGRAEQYVGTVNVYSAPYFTMNSCSVSHSEGLLVHFRGNTSNATIQNNVFEDFHIALFSDSNDISGMAPKYIEVNNNNFSQSWGSLPEQNYFGGIKFQNVGNFDGSRIPARSCGHRIVNNVFSGTNQMGVELWGYISDSVVSNNYFENCYFGISIAEHTYGVNVSNNNIKSNGYIGIEIANAQNITVANNVIDGGTGYFWGDQIARTQDGIIVNNALYPYPSNVSIIGNVVSNCASRCLHLYFANNVNVVGNQFIQSGTSVGQNLYLTNSSYSNISNNILLNTTGAHFILLNADAAAGLTGVTIDSNDFRGSVSQWGILSYAPVGRIYNLVVKNNRTYGVKYCGFGMSSISDGVISAILQDNIGQTGNLGYYISDQTIPAGSSPYSTASKINAYDFYTVSTLTLTGETSPSGFWTKISSYDEGSIQAHRFGVSFASNLPPYSYDNKKDQLYFSVSQSAYSNNGSISIESQSSYLSNNNNFIEEIRTNNPGAGSIVETWIKFPSGSTGISGLQVYFYGDSSIIASPTIQENRPDFTNSVGLSLNTVDRRSIKTTYGMQIGQNSSITSPQSGLLIANVSSGFYIGNSLPTTASAPLTFGNSLGNTKIALYDDINDTVYGMGIQPFQFRFHVDTPSSYFSFLNGPDGSGILTVKGDGKAGICTTNPTASLHVSGTLRTDISTSTTATSGNIVLPSGAVGFITVNITGGDFKIPYYNI